MSETKQHKTAYKCCCRRYTRSCRAVTISREKAAPNFEVYKIKMSVIDFSLKATCLDEFPRWDKYSCYS